MAVFPVDIEVTRELAQKGELGGESVDEGGFFAETHDQPIGIPIKRIFETCGIETTPLIDDKNAQMHELYRRSDLWLIPHGASIVRRSGFAEPTAVGIEVRYKNEGRTCSVRSLIPSFRFIEHGHVRGKFDLSGEMDRPDMFENTNVLKDFVGLKCGLIGKGQLAVHFEATVATPYISSVGENSSRCEWRFDKYREPLFGRDIATWAVVALPKRQTELKYDIRFYFTARTLVISRRYESAWIERLCRLDR